MRMAKVDMLGIGKIHPHELVRTRFHGSADCCVTIRTEIITNEVLPRIYFAISFEMSTHISDFSDIVFCKSF